MRIAFDAMAAPQKNVDVPEENSEEAARLLEEQQRAADAAEKEAQDAAFANQGGTQSD